MARYEILHNCGHRAKYQFHGRVPERQRRVERAESRECRDCIVALERERIAGLRDEAAEADLPGLVGTAAQVEWARDIRTEALLRLDEFLSGEQMAALRKTASAEQRAYLDRIVTAVQSADRARWWIEQARGRDGESVFRSGQQLLEAQGEAFPR